MFIALGARLAGGYVILGGGCNVTLNGNGWQVKSIAYEQPFATFGGYGTSW